MQQGTILALAVAMAVFATPLFFDLALSIMGNLFRARGPHGARGGRSAWPWWCRPTTRSG